MSDTQKQLLGRWLPRERHSHAVPKSSCLQFGFFASGLRVTIVTPIGPVTVLSVVEHVEQQLYMHSEAVKTVIAEGRE